MDSVEAFFMNKSRKNRKMHIIAGIVAVALILYASVTLISIKTRTQHAQEQKAALEQKIEEITEENKHLQYQLEHSEDDDTIKDIAREKLGLVEPGEIIFYDEAR